VRLIVAGLAAALALALIAGQAPAADEPQRGPARVAPSELKPEMTLKKIPYGETRRRQMAGYSQRHYGVRTWRMTHPHVIVQHYTDGTSFLSAWNHFASNARHNGEKPGVCTHFIVDTDGTIYRLVDMAIRCRHVVGLNHVSYGIEHVGTSSAMVLGNDRQMASSLALTVWLMARYDVDVGNVIGHAEALQSPYHYELYPEWRCLVHADFRRRAMQTYRDRLKDALRAAGVPLGDGPEWEPSGC
jgi:hypothetical protein